MKTKLQFTAIYILILGLLISGCSPASPAQVAPTDADLLPTAISTLLPTVTTTPALTPTVAPTATVYPPVFDPETIGDNRVLLDSFILTRTDTTTGSGEVKEDHITIGYIKEPFSAYRFGKYLYPGGGKEDEKYLIEGRLYQGFSDGGWYFTQEASPHDIDLYFQSAAETSVPIWVISAQFVGQEDFAGIPANHFTLDQTNLREYSDPTGTYKIESAVGNIYLAQDGNYLLYYHMKVTGNIDFGETGYSPGVEEVTAELSSINQLTEIAVPADFDLELDFGLPLPAETTFVGITRYGGGGIPDLYHYKMPVSQEEFFEFYKNMAPTNGFTFSRIGRVTDHPVCADYLDQDCVILTNGSTEFILYYAEDLSGPNFIVVIVERDK